MSKTALVTGASRGIGAATARLLAAQGYSVAVNHRDSDAQAQALAKAIMADGGKAIVVQANMGIEKDVGQMFEAIEKKLGPVTALINNAGMNLSGSLLETDLHAVEELMRTNMFSVFLACRAAAQSMKKAGGGAIVNVSSEAAKFGGNNMAHYAASKGAINSFTLGVARELAAANIRINVVSPGVIDTEAHGDKTPERLAVMKASLPMGRMGTAQEVAETIAWLLSDKASYVSGSVITVAGAR